MTQIGHNGGPDMDPFDAHKANIDDLFDMANGVTEVTSDEQEAAATEMLDDLRAAQKAADAARVEEKRPFDDGAKAVQAKWKPLLAKPDVAIAHVKAMITPFRAERDRLARVEADRLRAEAERIAREARELAASDDLDERIKAEDAIKQARITNAQANKVAGAATGLRTSWDAEITDRRAALNHYIKTQPEAFALLIQSLADRDARGTRPPTPGVVFHERKTAA